MRRGPFERVSVLVFAFLLGRQARGQQPAATVVEPGAPIVASLVADTDGDGREELLLVEREGHVVRWAATAEGTFVVTGRARLRDPVHTLLAVADLDPRPGVELVVADGLGTGHVVWGGADGAEGADGTNGEGEIRTLVRRARCTLRLGFPQVTPFVQDLDRDGRLDLLLPALTGVQPFLQEAADAGGAPAFRALPTLPVDVEVLLGERTAGRDQELEGRLVVPQIETADLDGDGRPDLLTHDEMRHGFHLQTEAGTFAPPIEVDLAQFVDSTPKATLAPGSTVVFGDRQLLQRGDVDGDGIPDFVIAHRRKVWTFLGGKDGPQFTKARTQAVADDVTAMLVLDVDEDSRADLLAFQVQLPSVGSLLLGLVRSLDVDIKAVGYRSEGGGFAATPAWRRVLTLRVPPLLSLLSRQEELVRRFADVVAKARVGVRGRFSAAATRSELALLHADGAALELFEVADGAPSLAGARGRRLMMRLLFEDEDTVFDLDRLFAVTSGLLDDVAGGLVGDRQPTARAPLRDPGVWRVVDLLPAELDGAAPGELIVGYERVDAGDRPARQTPIRAFERVVWQPVDK